MLVEHIFGLMGSRGGGTGRISLRKVRVPETNRVGPLNGGALIFDQMMIPERMTSGAACIGTAQAALDLAARDGCAEDQDFRGRMARVLPMPGISWRRPEFSLMIFSVSAPK